MTPIPTNDQPPTNKHIAGEVFIVVMGVSGTGKSTLGTALAKELGMPYVEGDDLHPRTNVEKMSRGVSLTDADREPWLELIRRTAEDKIAESHTSTKLGEGNGVVITCSALKRCYRDILRGEITPASSKHTLLRNSEGGPHGATFPTYFVFINGSREVLKERMENRKDHFFKASLLDSQLDTLESPEGEGGVAVVPLEASTDEQVRIAVEELKSFLHPST